MSSSIPAYPQTRPLQLSDQELLNEVFRSLQPLISEFSFANLFLFRHVHQYALSMIADSITIFGSDYDGNRFFLPPLCGERIKTARKLLQEGHLLYGADGMFATELHSYGNYSLYEDRDNFDYLYLRSELSELPGNRFHKKKNRINYFTSRHNFIIDPFSRKHLDGSLHLLEEWKRVHDGTGSRSLAAETAAAREGVELAEDLGLSGLVVLMEGIVSAFALGEILNDTTWVCHFEKANPFFEGLAQLVNREYSRSLPPSCSFINREQDLGENGLRKAKLSYHPADFVKKFRISSVS